MKLLLMVFIFSFLAFGEEVYLTVKGDNIETIIEKNLPIGLSEEEKYRARKMIKRDNNHVRDWYSIRPATQVDLSQVSFETKEVIYVEDNPDLYLDQALYQLNLYAGFHTFTYLESFSEFEVQSDTYSLKNYGASMLYSFGKHKKYWRYEVGYYSSTFSFTDETSYWFKVYKEKKRRNHYYYLRGLIRDQTFSTLDELQTKIQKQRQYQFLNLGYQTNYYFFDNPSSFYFELALLIDGEGDDLSGESGFGLNIGNSYGISSSISIKPFIEYTKILTDVDSTFLSFGIDLSIRMEVL
jgi:hypothetical protein